jgi:2-polyprenyl-3-methyl-5-hydroxy-6-metoxy-1,4-benzoquinol methylase
MSVDFTRMASLRYEDFKTLASEEGLSPHERIGFPDAYRDGQEEAILADLRSKASNLGVPASTIVDIGCGCGVLAQRLIDYCSEMTHRLVIVDSAQVLARLPDPPHVCKVAGRFPQETSSALAELCGRADVVIAYSVLHYIVLDSNPFDFLDQALALLAPGGELLVGDVPNVSMRRRFFSSDAGKTFHRSFTGTDTDPDVVFNTLEPDKIDDSVVLGLVMRARSAGFDAYVMRQRQDLPMANRREDLLVRRP